MPILGLRVPHTHELETNDPPRQTTESATRLDTHLTRHLTTHGTQEMNGVLSFCFDPRRPDDSSGSLWGYCHLRVWDYSDQPPNTTFRDSKGSVRLSRRGRDTGLVLPYGRRRVSVGTGLRNTGTLSVTANRDPTLYRLPVSLRTGSREVTLPKGTLGEGSRLVSVETPKQLEMTSF